MESTEKVSQLRIMLTIIVGLCDGLQVEAMDLGLHVKAAGFADIQRKAKRAISENEHLWR